MYAKDRVAMTPPMGWNSWDCYGPAVNEEQLLALSLIHIFLKAAGHLAAGSGAEEPV